MLTGGWVGSEVCVVEASCNGSRNRRALRQQLTDRQHKLREIAATRAVGPETARLLHEVAGMTESR